MFNCRFCCISPPPFFFKPSGTKRARESPAVMQELCSQQVLRSIQKRVSTDTKSALIATRLLCQTGRSSSPGHIRLSPTNLPSKLSYPQARFKSSRRECQQVGINRSQARLCFIYHRPPQSSKTTTRRVRFARLQRTLAAFSPGPMEPPITGKVPAGPRSRATAF